MPDPLDDLDEYHEGPYCDQYELGPDHDPDCEVEGCVGGMIDHGSHYTECSCAPPWGVRW